MARTFIHMIAIAVLCCPIQQSGATIAMREDGHSVVWATRNTSGRIQMVKPRDEASQTECGLGASLLNANLRERDNLPTKDKKPVPNESVIQRFHCILSIHLCIYSNLFNPEHTGHCLRLVPYHFYRQVRCPLMRKGAQVPELKKLLL